MNKNRPLGVTILGTLIILSSFVLFLPILLSSCNFALSTAIGKIVKSFTLLPYFILPYPIKSSLTLLLVYSIGLMLGIGILKLSNFCRIGIIVISIMQIVELILTAIAYLLDIPNFLEFFYLIGVVLIRVFYIIYLTRPKVKEQFKKEHRYRELGVPDFSVK